MRSGFSSLYLPQWHEQVYSVADPVNFFSVYGKTQDDLYFIKFRNKECKQRICTMRVIKWSLWHFVLMLLKDKTDNIPAWWPILITFLVHQMHDLESKNN